MTASTSPYQSNFGASTLTASTTMTADGFAGVSVIPLSAAAGLTITLPASTGSGNVYRFFVATTVTSNAYLIKVANATDVIQGVLGVATDAAGVNVPTAATTDTISMNGSTTGGLIGSYVTIIDAVSGVFSVSGALISTGTEATPFSATVS